MDAPYWRRCSSCKKPLPFDAIYHVCNISTCNRKRTGLVFCSVDCWDAHLPVARHKDAWSEERQSPPQGKADAAERAPQRLTMVAPKATSQPSAGASSHGLSPRPQEETLVVVSRLKAYVQARSGFNTSADAMTVLSEHIRSLCDRAMDRATQAGRRTVMGRDFDALSPDGRK
jgi:hypothetical protein